MTNAKNYTSFTQEQRKSLIGLGIVELRRTYFVIEDVATWTAKTTAGDKIQVYTSRGANADSVIDQLSMKVIQ